MSYFAFGLVHLRMIALDRDAYAHTLLVMRRCANEAGLAVSIGAENEPAVLSEMRGAFVAEGAIPFLCLARPEDDTSDGLISPHVVGVEGACDGARSIVAWTGCVLSATSVDRVAIWFTDGFDDRFDLQECGVGDGARLLATRIRDENDVPSIVLVVRGAPAEVS